MVKLERRPSGGYSARKRIPNNVREEYAKRYGPKHEAKFSAPVGTDALEARRLYREWLDEVEGRIAAITAERSGTGVALTKRDARALAGEWYDWFIGRFPLDDAYDMLWDDLWDRVQHAIQDEVTEEEVDRHGYDRLWADREDVRAAVRPVLADIGETAQFLAAKKLVLNNEAHTLFLDYLYEDLTAALHRLERLSQGNYSPDQYRERFPKLARAARA